MEDITGYIVELLAAAPFRAQTESRCCETLRLPCRRETSSGPDLLSSHRNPPGGSLTLSEHRKPRQGLRN